MEETKEQFRKLVLQEQEITNKLSTNLEKNNTDFLKVLLENIKEELMKRKRRRFLEKNCNY